MTEQQPSPVAIRIAVGLVGLLVVGVVVISQVLGTGDPGAAPATGTTSTPPPPTGPVALVAVHAPQAGSAECTRLTGALPGRLPNADNPLRRLALAEPAPPAAAAWGGALGEPVVLRCGLARPAELTPTARLQVIDGVQWVAVPGDGATTWYAVDRAVYIALTVPKETAKGPGPLQEISATVSESLAAVPIRTS